MLKKSAQMHVRAISLFEIFLLVSLSVCIAFILDKENVVSAKIILLPDGNYYDDVSLEKVAGGGTVNPPAVTSGAPTGTSNLKVTMETKNGDIIKGVGEQTTRNIVPANGADNVMVDIAGKTAGKQPLSALNVNADGTSNAVIGGKDVPLDAVQTKELQSQIAAQGGQVVSEEQFSIMGNTLATGGVAHLLNGLMWAGIAYGVIRLVAPMLGAGKSMTNALSTAAAAGIMTHKILTSLGPSGFNTGAPSWLTGGITNWGISIGVGVVIFLMMYKKEKVYQIQFQCYPFEPPSGNKQQCEDCNKDPMRPCSEYRCKSLGQSCQLVNQGTSKEMCVWVNKFDVKAPIIKIWNDATYPRHLKSRPDNAIMPPDTGVELYDPGEDKCLDAYTPLQFGIATFDEGTGEGEPSQCKIDFSDRTNGSYTTFDAMGFYMGENNMYLYNHTQKFRLPGPDSNTEVSATPELRNDGSYTMYIRCRDANDNQNAGVFAVKFCVDKGPDTTVPIIEETSITDGSPVQYNIDKVPISVFINEPADCKWSREDKNYDDMENIMSCATEAYQVNADLQYSCTGDLTAIENMKDNNFYFRCRDNPGKSDAERNTMTMSYNLTLKGSQPLSILEVKPNGTLYSPTDIMKVTLSVLTDDGANEGKANCAYSSSGAKDSFILMANTNTEKGIHTQNLDLQTGNYIYYFRCIDAGGNAAENTTTFSVIADKSAPLVTRVFREGADAIKIITDEDAKCVYSVANCNYAFKDGTEFRYMSTTAKTTHIASWKPGTAYYVKCKDSFNNEPSPNYCSIVISATRFGEIVVNSGSSS